MGRNATSFFASRPLWRSKGFLISLTRITLSRFNPRPLRTCFISFVWPTVTGALSLWIKAVRVMRRWRRALQQVGGSPVVHRTDSLSATRNNRRNVWTEAFSELCQHYYMPPTRNNLGESHENDVVKCAKGSLKKRLAQQLLLCSHSDFESIAT